MKVLITGFDPFGGEKINPALEAVKLLPDVIAEAEIIKLEIPTVFRKSLAKIEDAMELHKPDVVISIGQAGGRASITPERIAINIDDARGEDNEGNIPIDDTIYEDGENAYFSNLPVKAIIEAIKKAGIPAELSNSGGTYVCNHVMYGVLYLVNKKYKNVRAGFIHVPFIPCQVISKPQYSSMSINDIVKGLEIAIKTTIETESDLKISGGTIC